MRLMAIRIAALIALLLLVIGTPAQETPTPSPTPENSVALSIWWPDALVGSRNNLPNALLLEQSSAFEASETNLTIEHRLKTVNAVGGVLSTLRTAANVAPEAMPSLTLLRRQDLLFAQRAGLIQSMEGGISSAIQGDLNALLELGQVNGELYGLPYMIDVQHSAYHVADDDEDRLLAWDFESFLDRGQPLLFPGTDSDGLNNVFLTQYLSAGNAINADGMLILEEDALRATLTFYENAVDQGLVSDAVLSYADASAYAADFSDDQNAVAVMTSSDFLNLYAEDDTLRVGSIPTASGQPTALVNGWMWVLVATNPLEQDAALRYITWIMDSNRQSAAGEALLSLPSRRPAIEQGLAADAPSAPFIALLERPLLPVSESEGGLLGRAMQDGFAAVLTGDASAEEAAEQIITTVE